MFINMGGISGYTLCLAVSLLILNYQVEPTTAAKPKKHDYTIEIESAEMLDTPRGCFGPSTRIYTSLYNETTTVLMGDFDVVTDAPEDVMTTMTGFKFDSSTNQWIMTWQKKHTYCDFKKEQAFLFDRLYKNGNFSSECPIKKGSYYFRNYMADNSQLPSHLGESRWRVVVLYFTKSNKETVLHHSTTVLIKPIEDDD